MRVRACTVDRYRRVNRGKLHLPAVLPPLLSRVVAVSPALSSGPQPGVYVGRNGPELRTVR